MRKIAKGPEPASLTRHRQTDNADYENYRDKETLRLFLVAEQRGLCCYCLRRIRPEITEMKIAHCLSQHNHPDEQLSYANLLGACKGNEGQKPAAQHCDTKQGSADLSRNPADPIRDIERTIRFEGDGTITASDPAFDKELNDVLNLNLKYLQNNRKAVLDAFKETLNRKGDIGRRTLEKWLCDWNGELHNGELQPYCQVVVFWLRKRLARA